MNLLGIGVTVVYELNLRQTPAEIVHRKEFSNLKDSLYPFMALLSDREPIELILSTIGSDLEEPVPTEQAQLAALNPNYPWILKQYGSLPHNGTLFDITACNELGYILGLVKTW